MSEKGRLFVGIAVQSPDGLEELPGVHDALDRMAEFARVSGDYDDPILISDKNNEAVTAKRIKESLTADVLLDRPRIHIYFCGHGAFLNGTEIWYLSNGMTSYEERVDVMWFRDVLATYGPEQITIFSDACQTPVHHLTKAAPILPEHPGKARPPEYDTFRATIVGEAAYATKEDGPLFSKAMAEALSVTLPNPAIDEQILGAHGQKVVSSQSLKIYVRDHLPDYAADTGEDQYPELMPCFVYNTNDYLSFPNLPGSEVETPATGAGGEAGSRSAEAGAGDIALKNTASALQTRSPEAMQAALNSSLSEWRGPFWDTATSWAKNWEDEASLIVRVDGIVTSEIADIRLHLADKDDYLVPVNVVDGFASFNKHDLWIPEMPQRTGVLQINDIFVPLGLGVSWSLTLIANVLVMDAKEQDSNGAHVIGWHEVGFGDQQIKAVSPMQVLKGMLNGYLGADAIAPIAAEMRLMKHSDPLFGIVAAYLYDRAGDIASIQRICYFYGYYEQAVPFDIALLSRLPLRHHERGGFWIDVPAVEEDPIGKANGLPEYAWQATPPGGAMPVSGVVPLLRMGWSRLNTLVPRDSSFNEFGALREVLTEAPFASVNDQGAGLHLLQLIRTIYRNG